MQVNFQRQEKRSASGGRGKPDQLSTTTGEKKREEGNSRCTLERHHLLLNLGLTGLRGRKTAGRETSKRKKGSEVEAQKMFLTNVKKNQRGGQGGGKTWSQHQ